MSIEEAIKKMTGLCKNFGGCSAKKINKILLSGCTIETLLRLSDYETLLYKAEMANKKIHNLFDKQCNYDIRD